MTLPDSLLAVVVYAVIGLVVFLIAFFAFMPKRARRTVNYMLRTYQEFRQVRADPNADIEVPNFETMREPRPAVAPPRRKTDKPITEKKP